MEFIDLKTQYKKYKQEIDAAIHGILDSGQYILGETCAKLERSLAEFAGVKHALGVSSGTDSLQIALMALGVGPGDEVITVPFTWISTAEVIKLVGATPVFVDIQLDTYNIDIEKLEAAITPNTKAIIPVSLFGQMPDCDQINAIAKKHGIAVIEDGAQSFGATQNGKMSCGVTTIGSTSFFPAKPLGCYGDGGALFTNDDELAEKMKAIRVHGGIKRHEHLYLGLNGRLDAMQAAVLQVKLSYFPEEVEKRKAIGTRYSELLKDVCEVPVVQEGNTHVYAIYTIRIPDRDAVAAKLREQGIPCGVYYPKAVYRQPPFADCGRPEDFLICEKVCDEVLSLPMHPWLTEEEQDQIVSAVKEAVTVKV